MIEFLDREALLEGQARVLERIASRAPLPETLLLLLELVETHARGMLASVLLTDDEGRTLRHAIAPSLPADYLAAIDGAPIREGVGSCGTAAFRQARVVVEDIDLDPLWDQYREVARAAGLRACWSTPVLGPDAQLLGTLAMYYRSPASPSAADCELIDMATHLAAVAIGLDRDEAALAIRDAKAHADEARFHRQRDALIALTAHASLYGVDVDGALRHIVEAEARTLDVSRVSLWRYTPDRRAIRCVMLYDAATGLHEAGGELSADRHPAYFAAMGEGKIVAADDAQSDPRTREFTDTYLRPLNIGAMLDAPFHVRGMVEGVLCHEHVGGSRPWMPDEKTFAVAVANLVSLAIETADRLHVQAELQEARDRLQRAVHASQVGLWDWDLPTNTIRYSDEWKRQLGYDPSELPDLWEEWEHRLHPDDAERVQDLLRKYLEGESGLYEVDFRLRHRDGSYRYILARGSKQADANGTVVRMAGTHMDVTERMDLQAQLQQAQKMESVGRLAGGIAHDFNNLLTVINGTAELATDGVSEDSPIREDLLQIAQAGNRAAALTQQLLAFSRRQMLNPVVLNLGVVVLGMRDMLRRLIGEGIRLEVSVAHGLGSVRADPGQIEQVVMNLVVNAHDAMKGGGTLAIDLRNVDIDGPLAQGRASLQPGPYVLLTLSDSGTGMDEATRLRIFEPFFTTKEPTRGTGLGLSTVYGIVQQSAGSIRVFSEPGQGTRFELHFPRVDEPATARGGQVAEAVRGVETVLLVEDEPGVRSLAQRILQSAGYTVITAEDAAMALRLLEPADAHVDLLLTDVVLPNMNGRELADRAAATRPGLKVLYTSGYTDDEILRHGVLDAAAHFVAKPYTQGELTRKVREVLDR